MLVEVPVPWGLAQRLAEGDATFAVTGATGWFGRVTLDLLGRVLGADAFSRRVTGYASRAREVAVAGVGPIKVLSLKELVPAEIVFHYAFVTCRRLAPDDLDVFVRINVEITAHILKTVASGQVRGLFVTSSGAARCPDLQTNPYGTLKAIDELAIPEACRRAGASCVVARVFNVAGAHMTQPKVYALGDLIGRARAGRPLKLSAHGDVIRSYVGVDEVVLIALGELLQARSAFFETAGDQPVEIEGLARTVLRVLGREDLDIVRDRHPDAPADVYLGDGVLLRELAARHGVSLRGLESLVSASAVI